MAVDATPDHAAVVVPGQGKATIFVSKQPILDNEYIAILLAHIMFPNRIILTDNVACLYLFLKGKLPPSWRGSFVLTLMLMLTWQRPSLQYVPTIYNPADAWSRPPYL